MRLDKVDLNLFVVFDAIYRERSVSKVAALLNLTQPAVSNALSRLRQTFDDQLFVRTPEGMTPTPVSEVVIADVRKALVLLGQSVGANARFNPATSEKIFHLGMNDLGQALILPVLQQRLIDVAPHVSVSSYYVDRLQATEELKSGALDLLIDSPAVNAKDFKQRPLATLPYVVAMCPDHPLVQTSVSLNDYLAAEHIHVSSRRRGRGQMDVALHALGYQRQIMMRVQNYLVAANITEKTEMLWTVPKVLVGGTGLKQAPLPFDVEPLLLNIYWYKNAGDDPANKWMRELISEIVSAVL